MHHTFCISISTVPTANPPLIATRMPPECDTQTEAPGARVQRFVGISPQICWNELASSPKICWDAPKACWKGPRNYLIHKADLAAESDPNHSSGIPMNCSALRAALARLEGPERYRRPEGLVRSTVLPSP